MPENKTWSRSHPGSFSRQTLTAMCLQCQRVVHHSLRAPAHVLYNSRMPNNGRSETSHDDCRAVYSPRWHSPFLMPRTLHAFRFWIPETPCKMTANAPRRAAHAEPILLWPACAWEGDFPHSLPKITIGVNDPISSRLHSLLLFLHGFLTPEHPQGELIHPGLHHGSKLPLHKPGLPGRGVYIVKTDHGFFPVPLDTHWVAVVFHVLAPHAVLQDRVLPLEYIIPIHFLLFVARERIGFVFHGGFRTCCLRVRRTGYA